MKKLLMTLAGTVVGYAVMVALITLVQEVWFGGVAWGTTAPGALALAGFFTCVSAAVGAVVATIIARATGRAAAVLMACVVALETTVLSLTGKLSGPLWFDLGAALSLIVAILLGAELWLRWASAHRRQPSGA